MKKILFAITSLTLGGAERVLVDLANRLKKEYEITIVTLYATGELEKQLEEGITLKSIYPCSYEELSTKEKKKISLQILIQKKKLYEKYVKGSEVEIAFLEGPMTRILSVANPNTKKIAWIHNDISQVFGQDSLSKWKKRYDYQIYQEYDHLVLVSQDNLEKFQTVYPRIPRERMQVILNYLDAKRVKQKAEEPIQEVFTKDVPNFVTVTRLTKQKGTKRFLEVHAKLIQEGIYHRVYVIGDGPEKEMLQNTIQELGVQDTFMLLGKKENPYPYMKQADYFCLFSHFEGYGMVLEEAKLLDKTILITDTAAREALQNYSKRTIVPNTQEGIQEGMRKAIQNKEIKQAKEIPYENELIIQKFKELVGE